MRIAEVLPRSLRFGRDDRKRRGGLGGIEVGMVMDESKDVSRRRRRDR